ncbi:DUF2520 domain-containing protein [Apibacter muscae]|uniref:DUF2520 domain-containing protein n=1 Tax=Apibacter muscae TaxID=2509004 RepID=A0A563DGW3_9FLAO|nr:DUF2520 domain-containing protein [Apibacter muscae]TWP23816.1 DUF2520 domain-containing protein [Apibacter muscae]TWP29103.1 DUF2520 domain-containing protein [Apibacter muscae]TWP30316.1 DUF2520 domain-containing protein [Apibacter muscae]
MFKTVVIVGAGNVAYHLTRALLENTVNLVQIFNRTLSKAQLLAENYNISYTDKISEIKKADIYIICTSDDAISEISYYIPFDDCLVVHTSGSTPISALKGKYRKGVFYPLQTFTQGRSLEYDKIPFFIEAENSSDEGALLALAERISEESYLVDYEKRMKIHMAGVWANNFTNHLYLIAEEICKKQEIPFDALKSIIKEGVDKLVDGVSPYDAQTGPARRLDKSVIEKHLSILEATDSKLFQIYNLLTESIIKLYHEKL